jgi:hypothetical protein
MVAPDDDDPQPPERLSPATRAYIDMLLAANAKLRKTDRELAATNVRLRESLIDAALAHATDDDPRDFVPLKVALAHAPHVHPERARRLCESQAVLAKQNCKGGHWYPSLSSFLAATRRITGKGRKWEKVD